MITVTKLRTTLLILISHNHSPIKTNKGYTRFKKLKYPKFDGDILYYQELQRRWRLEVVPEWKPVQLELAALREALTATAKAKIKDFMSVDKAWKIID